MTPTIRPSTVDDAAAVTRVLTASYAKLFDGWYAPAVLEAVLPVISVARPELLASGTYLVAEADDVVMACGGWTAVNPATQAATHGVGHTRHFATHPDFLRRGLARGLMTASMASARADGIERLECVSSLPAERFYAAMGFVVERRGEVELRDGLMLPCVYMSRAL